MSELWDDFKDAAIVYTSPLWGPVALLWMAFAGLRDGWRSYDRAVRAAWNENAT